MVAMLDRHLSEVLEKIEGFTYTVVGNYLNYQFNNGRNTFEGVIEMGTDDFENLSREICNRKPKSFQALLALGLV